MDVSFISVTKVLPSVEASMAPAYTAVILIKPQFEAGPKNVGKGGIVRDLEVHRHILRETAEFVAERLDGDLLALCRSVLPGTGGNIEYFFHLGRGGENGLPLDTLDSAIDGAVRGAGKPAGGRG
jgi:23S rRNA (cytidine1920-2'-O)/16S rRNA (cytidine1409-2'-O)-methyltransferase